MDVVMPTAVICLVPKFGTLVDSIVRMLANE
jgi:hypothetical protein